MYRRWLIMALALVIGLGFTCEPVSAKVKKEKKGKPVYYLSLGTSLAAGVQADPDTGESVVTDVSYPGFLAEILKTENPGFRHVNLGCPGETSDAFIDGGICEYKRGSQLAEAVKFLRSKGKNTRLITLDIGANDILRCIDGTEIDMVCFTEAIQNLTTNLIDILNTLRWAAGPNVPIVAMNYYNPLAVFWFQDPDLAADTNLLQGIVNSALEGVYTAFGVPVADVASAYMSGDLVTDNDGNLIPDSLDLLCGWTWMCSHSNIHPNADGYSVIADVFADTLPPLE